MGTLSGRVIVITGGARGQGAQQARDLVAAGASVVVTDLLEAEGAALVAELGARSLFVRHDVADADGWRRAMDAAASLGRVHGLVNNAGVYLPTPLADTDAALLERHFRVNQLGAALGMRYAAEAMKRSGGGSIVNISSVAGTRGMPNTTAYGGTKWALRGMTKTAAVELGPHGIRVNSVHPGLIDTPMLDVRRGVDLEERATKVPLGRLGTPGDVAALVLFLLSDESSYITGAEITVDGGISI